GLPCHASVSGRREVRARRSASTSSRGDSIQYRRRAWSAGRGRVSPICVDRARLGCRSRDTDRRRRGPTLHRRQRNRITRGENRSAEQNVVRSPSTSGLTPPGIALSPAAGRPPPAARRPPPAARRPPPIVPRNPTSSPLSPPPFSATPPPPPADVA